MPERHRNDFMVPTGPAGGGYGYGHPHGYGYGPPPPHAMAPYGPPMHPSMPGQQQHDNNAPNVIAAILKNWWLVVLFAVIGAAVAWVYLRQTTPLFTSYAKIYLEPSSNAPIGGVDPLGVQQRGSFLYTQCEVIRSTPNLTEAVKKLPGLKTFEAFGGNGIWFLRENVSVEVGRRDDIITVAIDSPHPDEAAKIIDAVVDTYVQSYSVLPETKATGLLATLQTKKNESLQQIKAYEAQMLEYRRLNPKLAISNVMDQRVQQFATALTNAQIATINARSNYAPGHPMVQKAQATEEALYTGYQEALKAATEINGKVAEYQRMQLELTHQQDFAKQLEESVRRLELAQRSAPMVNRIEQLEPAFVPVSPSFPRKNRTMAVALAAGMLLGAGLALLRDRMDGRMRSVEEIQTVIGMPILGVVPQMSGRRTAVARAMTVHLDPRSVVAEAYRTIRTAVYFGAGDNRCKTILVTSPEPGDGKTTSASNLAIAIAQTGRSVLLLDADFRKPTQHKNLDIKDAVGLSSVLAGRENLAKAIQHTGVDGLDILPCGPIPANPSEILNSREFGELVDALAEKYDHIIFDSPPVNAVTDARILGAVCDATILTLRADKSTRKAGEHARNALLGVGARVLGAIVNDAPHRKGYEVYGGSYYGTPDVVVRAGGYDPHAGTRRLSGPRAVSNDATEGNAQRRRDSA